MFKLSTAFKRLCPFRTVLHYSSSSAPAVQPDIEKSNNGTQPVKFVNPDQELSKDRVLPTNTGLVAAAFASLTADVDSAENQSKTLKNKDKQSEYALKKQLDDKITEAKDVKSILSIVEHPALTRKHALRIVAILSEWSSTNKAVPVSFNRDERFLKLCRFLGRQSAKVDTTVSVDLTGRSSEDLNTVLGVTGDDQAARLIASLNLPQMIKVMSSLAQKKRRSTPLLRTLSYNITRQLETIDLKKCADLLFSMAVLNFPDGVLMDRVCRGEQTFGMERHIKESMNSEAEQYQEKEIPATKNDIQEKLPLNEDKSSVVGSIATSLGILKYKDTEILDNLSGWMVSHAQICRPTDVAALIVTLATLGYKPANLDKLPKIAQSEIAKPSTWLDIVWSLVVLDQVSSEDVSSVLNPEFVDSLAVAKGDEISFSAHKKLANINGYAKHILKDYKGPLLADDFSTKRPVTYSKEKQLFVSTTLDTLKSLLSSDANVKRICDSKMGFLYDAECLLDAKCIPYPVDSISKHPDKRLSKVALLSLDYHDICKQSSEPLGCILLYKRLLESQGYTVIFIPHTEFNQQEKLINRVQYLEKKLKEAVQGKAVEK